MSQDQPGDLERAARDLSVGSAPASSETIGRLAPTEAAMIDTRSPSVERLSEHLSDQLYEAEKMRAWFDERLKGEIRPEIHDLVKSYADWYAKEALVRDRIERMRLQRR